MFFLIILLLFSNFLYSQYGGERNLSKFNPEISVLGDFFLEKNEDEKTKANLKEIEISFQSALDPYTRMKLFLGIHKEEDHFHLDIEEGYITYAGLAKGLNLEAGKQRQPFGIFNRYHSHSLPTEEYPLYLRNFFGEEGLSSPLLSLSYLFQTIGASTITAQFGTYEEDNAFLGNFKQFFEINPENYLEIGFSYFSLKPEARGFHFRYLYEPAEAAKYRNFLFHYEYGERNGKKGHFLLFERKFSQIFTLGLAFEKSDLLEEEKNIKKISAILSFWQSEFVRLRFYFTREKEEEWANSLKFSITFAAGPHKHEEY